MHSSLDNGFSSNVDQNDEFKDAIVLEHLLLASLPPEPVITDEEFKNKIDLMMMDSDSMDVGPSSDHDIV
ncbi:hypothetical protein MKX03_035189, partial [Papaver bracteatum]